MRTYEGDGNIEMMRFSSFCIALVLGTSPTWAETDVFLRAVSYALSGSDNTDVRVADQANCIFENKSERFFLNRVHTDRLRISWWTTPIPPLGEMRWVGVSLHGDDVVYERDEKPDLKTLPPEFVREMKKIEPKFFEMKRYKEKEHLLRLAPEADIARVERAWKYVYANGCKEKQSPF